MSHSASFLQGWVDHVYDNRILYSSSQSSDPYFFVKVLFTIDSALQRHWLSCPSAPNRSSVNDAILRMDDVQEAILGLSFSQNLPRSISDKVLAQINSTRDGTQDVKGKNGKRFPGQDKQDKQDLIYDNDKSRQGWRAKENENFAKVFYKHQNECPKTADGKLICMKFFLRGICTKYCMRAHPLSANDSKKFESFINSCRKKAPRQDS
jgi:hypothetical protein